MPTSRRAKQVSRVFFAGAGFSAGMHYPIGRQLMRRLVGYLRGEAETSELVDGGFENTLADNERSAAQGRQLVKVIERMVTTYFGVPLSGIDQVDVAEFFTMAHTLSESPWLLDQAVMRRRQASATEISELSLFKTLAAVTRSYFYDISTVYPPPADVKSILARVRRDKDAIICFNWDEEIDIELSQRDCDVAYTLGDWKRGREVLVLKPHGSIGWYDLKQGIGNDEAYLIAGNDQRVARYEKRIVAYPANDWPLDIDRSTHSPLECPPVITSPTFAKRFDYVEQHRIWQDVLEVCGEAHEFVFLGYSLPRDDFLTRAAIRRSLRGPRQGRKLRCLIVDQDFADAKFLNFLSVFPRLSKTTNVLQWTFGSEDPGFGDRVLRRLRQADLP